MRRLSLIWLILLMFCWSCNGFCKDSVKAVITDLQVYNGKNDECFVKVSIRNNSSHIVYIEYRRSYSVYVNDSNLLQKNVNIVVPGYSAIKLIRGKDIPWSSNDMGILPPSDSLGYMRYIRFVDNFTRFNQGVKLKIIKGESYYVCYPNQMIEFYCTISFSSADVQLLLKTVARKKVDIDAIYFNQRALMDSKVEVIPILFKKEHVDSIKKRILNLNS